MDRLRVIRTLHTLPITLTLGEALTIADALHAEFAKPKVVKPVLSTFEGRVAFARSLPAVMEYVNADKKIHAIKTLRDILYKTPDGFPYSGLKEVKDVVDSIMSPY